MMNRAMGRGERGGCTSQFKQAGRGRGEQRSQKSTEGKGIGLETPPRTTRRSTWLKNKEENDSRNKQEEERKSEATMR
jgi:hypothetical protein